MTNRLATIKAILELGLQMDSIFSKILASFRRSAKAHKVGSWSWHSKIQLKLGSLNLNSDLFLNVK